MTLGPATIKVGLEDRLVGLTHAGQGPCGSDHKLSLYTSVYDFLGWICDNIDEKVNTKGACERLGTAGPDTNGPSSNI